MQSADFQTSAVQKLPGQFFAQEKRVAAAANHPPQGFGQIGLPPGQRQNLPKQQCPPVLYCGGFFGSLGFSPSFFGGVFGAGGFELGFGGSTLGRGGGATGVGAGGLTLGAGAGGFGGSVFGNEG